MRETCHKCEGLLDVVDAKVDKLTMMVIEGEIYLGVVEQDLGADLTFYFCKKCAIPATGQDVTWFKDQVEYHRSKE